MSGKGSVGAASAIGRGGCAAAAACRAADKHRHGSWEGLEQSADCRWHRSTLRSLACWLLLRNVEAASQTGIRGGSDSRKIDRRFTLRKPERRKNECLLC